MLFTIYPITLSACIRMMSSVNLDVLLYDAIIALIIPMIIVFFIIKLNLLALIEVKKNLGFDS